MIEKILNTFEIYFFNLNVQLNLGIFTENCGRKYIGNWIEGKLHGKVICISPTKIIRFGQWYQGKFLYWLEPSNSQIYDYNELSGNFNLLKKQNFNNILNFYNNLKKEIEKNESLIKRNDIKNAIDSFEKIPSKTGKICRSPRFYCEGTKKKNLEEWEKQAKILPHVPHINYNRVLGRWYARVKDPNTGKRLWKGYTCSIHGFLKARQMAVDLLKMHENDFENGVIKKISFRLY